MISFLAYGKNKNFVYILFVYILFVRFNSFCFLFLIVNFSDVENDSVTVLNATLNWEGRRLSYAYQNQFSRYIYLIAGAYSDDGATSSVVRFDIDTYLIEYDSNLIDIWDGNRSAYASISYGQDIYIMGGLNDTGAAIETIQFTTMVCVLFCFVLFCFQCFCF